MTKNRLLYSLIAAAMLCLAMLSGHPAAYTVLYAVLLLPALSFAMTFALRKWIYPKSLQAVGTLDALSIQKGENTQYRLQIINKGFLPCPFLQPVFQNSAGGLSIAAPSKSLMIPPYEKTESTYTVTGQCRGVYQAGICALRIYDPFGLFSFRQKVDLLESLTVLPRISPLNGFLRPRPDMTPLHQAGQSFTEDFADIIGLRQYRPADDLKRIHWPATAQKKQWISKDYQPMTRRSALVILDNGTLSGGCSAKGAEPAASKEDSILSLLASVLFMLADGQTEITLVYTSSPDQPQITSRHFEDLYKSISAASFHGACSFDPHRLLGAENTFDNIYLFSPVKPEKFAILPGQEAPLYHTADGLAFHCASAAASQDILCFYL